MVDQRVRFLPRTTLTLVTKGMAKLTTGVARKAMSKATFSDAPGFLALSDGTVKSHTNQNPRTWMEMST